MRASVFASSCTGREPTADGRAAQETVRVLATLLGTCIFRFLHSLLLALIAMLEAGSLLEMNNRLACLDLCVQGSNV